MSDGIPSYSLIHGASWLLEDGSVLPVPGFHEEWIKEHQDLVSGCANVCEIVLKKAWISVAVFGEGYMELLVPDRDDPLIISRIDRLLEANRGRWSRVLVMSMNAEGYEMIKADEARTPGAGRRSRDVLIEN